VYNMAQPIDIQIKRSLTNTPTTLLYGQPAWDDSIDGLYIGNSSGVPILVNDPAKADRWVFSVCRNANINSDQALRRQDGTFTNINPYSVPFNGIIYCVTAERENVNLSRTWDLVVEVNNSVVRTVSVGSGQRSVQDDNLNIAVSAGDDVAIYFRNSSAIVNKPGGVVYGRRT
jgi:hypothetical protein